MMVNAPTLVFLPNLALAEIALREWIFFGWLIVFGANKFTTLAKASEGFSVFTKGFRELFIDFETITAEAAVLASSDSYLELAKKVMSPFTASFMPEIPVIFISEFPLTSPSISFAISPRVRFTFLLYLSMANANFR
jgi:hypothetical protein